MNRFSFIVCLIFVCIFVALFFGMQVQEESNPVPQKIGVVMDGSRHDLTWNQAHAEGIDAAARKIGAEVLYRENVPEAPECAQVIEELIGEGCSLVVCTSFGFGEWLRAVAERHPDIRFMHATGTVTLPNLSTYAARMYQMRYVSGIVAGLQTQTGSVGYVASFPICETVRGINAFALGVRSVRRDAVVHVVFSNTWIDDADIEKATHRLLDGSTVDVVTMQVDSLKVHETAEQMGIWAIGSHRDLSEKFPKTLLTSAVWNWESFYTERFRECTRGKFRGRNYWEGLREKRVSMAPLSAAAAPGAAEAVRKAMKRFENDLFEVFHGPIFDTEKRIRVRAGESMTDDMLLNGFDWFVEGVKVHGTD